MFCFYSWMQLITHLIDQFILKYSYSVCNSSHTWLNKVRQTNLLPISDQKIVKMREARPQPRPEYTPKDLLKWEPYLKDACVEARYITSSIELSVILEKIIA